MLTLQRFQLPSWLGENGSDGEENRMVVMGVVRMPARTPARIVANSGIHVSVPTSQIESKMRAVKGQLDVNISQKSWESDGYEGGEESD